MILNRLVPVLLALVLILVFAYVALGAIYGVNCPWQFCKSPALSSSGAQAVVLKYYRDSVSYRVLGKIEAFSPCTWLYTDTKGGPTDPLSITLSTKSVSSRCSQSPATQTFYVEAERSTEVPISVTLDGSPLSATPEQVMSESELSF